MTIVKALAIAIVMAISIALAIAIVIDMVIAMAIPIAMVIVMIITIAIQIAIAATISIVIDKNRHSCDEDKIISIDINKDLESWLEDEDIFVDAIFPDSFRCIISGPSECGKTFLLKNLKIGSIYGDKIHIRGHTGDQYEGVESVNDKADVEFIKDIKDLPSPCDLPKDSKKLMIFMM